MTADQGANGEKNFFILIIAFVMRDITYAVVRCQTMSLVQIGGRILSDKQHSFHDLSSSIRFSTHKTTSFADVALLMEQGMSEVSKPKQKNRAGVPNLSHCEVQAVGGHIHFFC